MREHLVLVAALVLAACERSLPSSPPIKAAATPKPAAPAWIASPGTEAISVRTSACLGMCPVFKLTATPTAARFEGYYYTAVFGQSSFAISRQDFGRLEKMLAPARALSTGRTAYVANECPGYNDDSPDIEIRWQDPDGSLQGYFSGCREQDIDQKASGEAVRAAGRAAWSVTRWPPIARLIGTPSRNALNPPSL